MAEVAFRYLNTNTIFHRIDPRSKLLLLIGFSVIGAGRGWLGLLTLIPLVLSALAILRIPFRPLLKEMKGFLFFFISILFISTMKISLKAEGVPVTISLQGFLTGLMTVARMSFVILIAAFFTSVTKTRQMRDAIWWLFRPVPRINGVRVATMFSLSIRFIPLVFEEAARLRMASVSRGATGSGRPLRRISHIGFPLILRSFLRVDGIVRAMASRGYNEEHIRPELGFRSVDGWVLLAAAALGTATILLDRILI